MRTRTKDRAHSHLRSYALAPTIMTGSGNLCRFNPAADWRGNTPFTNDNRKCIRCTMTCCEEDSWICRTSTGARTDETS
ncbi:hypothetical protein BV898_12397 [Hypsibius exemplaris]|uniref:Uncharacterized protein n=1 Tax=Hypsibius exemplaris TaxID=2072580 RepID=A0A1W0WDW5_HYPEX|nr:hypothetical protein BV898_12397 [Hypsibius exemplaris]